MYTAYRHFYPHGIEGESMDCTFKEFDTIEEAIKYADRYARGLRFAGVQVEDENGNIIYEITSDSNVFDYRKEPNNG